MARRKIREFDAKNLIARQLNLEYKAVLITPETKIQELPSLYPWLLREKLVIKPDQLFGKRKQYNLVLAEVSFDEVLRFLEQHRNKLISLGKATDTLTHFLLEPFIPHQEEYYLAIISERDSDIIYFSEVGGFNIEERWNTVKTIKIPSGVNIEEVDFAIIPQHHIPFFKNLYKLYRSFHFTYLEINPFAVSNNNHQIHLLDCVAQVDDCPKLWSDFDFPIPFGQKVYPEEQFIRKLDAESGASLKLTVLNPQGRIWNILSGGGASIIFLDTIANLGRQEEIANYGEYSGNPTTEESYLYAKTILELVTKEYHPRGKVLIIGGAIANFTDVEKTFMGIIQALREYQEKLHWGKVSIFVRRGGPNYEKGLKLMEQAGKEIGIPMLVQGPDTPMVDIVDKAMEVIT
ncbi:ATPase [Candidatus Woesearchaeota archaeon]|nr:ATPase [Candidatus Woesearchaeota archaeon]